MEQKNKTLADIVKGGSNVQGAFNMDVTSPNFIVTLNTYTNFLNARYPVILELGAINQSDLTEIALFAIGAAQIFCQAWENYLGQTSTGVGNQSNLSTYRRSNVA